MPSFRLFPLLAAGAACLTLAACGSDDDPPPQANAPAAQSEPAAPTQTAPGETPTTSAAPDAAANGGSSTDDGAAPAAPSEDSPSAPDPASGDTTPANPDTGAAAPRNDGEAPAAKPDSKAKPKSESKAKPKSGSSAPDGAPKQGQQAPPTALDDYAPNGALATKDDAADVRATLIGFQEAVGRKDAVAVCALTVGLPEKSSPQKPMSCASVTEGGTAQPPSDQNRRLIAASKVVVGGDRATAELSAGFKLPLRKIDGRWRLDYDAINNPSGAGSR